MTELLLLSNSTNHGATFLAHALDAVQDWLGGRSSLLFVPFAKAAHDDYTATVAEALEPLGVSVRGVHTANDPVPAVREAEAVFVGGGNSFRLLQALHEVGLVEPLRERVREGMPYMGASAGTNMACPTLRTSNDMPIVQPPTFAALGFVPFQINPHYLDPDSASTHMGETREERLAEFHEENDVAVLGLREAAWLSVRGERATLGGETGARLFRRGAQAQEIPPGADLSALLGETPRFDQAAGGPDGARPAS
jgi:dipeptidase E